MSENLVMAPTSTSHLGGPMAPVLAEEASAAAPNVDEIVTLANYGDVEAAKKLEKIAKKYKDDVGLQANTILACLATGRVGAAKSAGSRIEKTGDPSTLWARAALAVATSDTKKGPALVGQLQPMMASSQEARALAGGMAMAEGRIDEAEQLLASVQMNAISPSLANAVGYAVDRRARRIDPIPPLGFGIGFCCGGVVGLLVVALIMKVNGSMRASKFGAATKGVGASSRPKYDGNSQLDGKTVGILVALFILLILLMVMFI